MDNVQNCGSYNNVPSSQICTSYLNVAGHERKIILSGVMFGGIVTLKPDTFVSSSINYIYIYIYFFLFKLRFPNS
jgi:hypothetical protein